MDDECLVLVFAHQVFQKGVAGDTLLLQHAPLAHAGVHQQAEREREIGFFGEVADRLRTAVFFQLEVVLGQVVYDLAVFVAHRGQHIDHFDVGREGRRLLARQSADRTHRRG